jgi:hypothetical protein
MPTPSAIRRSQQPPQCGDEDAHGFYDSTMMLKEGESF